MDASSVFLHELHSGLLGSESNEEYHMLDKVKILSFLGSRGRGISNYGYRRLTIIDEGLSNTQKRLMEAPRRKNSLF